MNVFTGWRDTSTAEKMRRDSETDMPRARNYLVWRRTEQGLARYRHGCQGAQAHRLATPDTTGEGTSSRQSLLTFGRSSGV